MEPAYQVLGWWVAFGGSHTLLSHPPIRTRLTHRLGEQGFRGVYSLVALATFIPLVTTFFTHRTARGIWLPALVLTPGVWWVTMVVNFCAILFIMIGFAQPNPISTLRGSPAPEARGILRISRHPGFMGFALLGLGHLFVLRAPVDWAFFGGLFVYSLLGAAHQDWRRLKADPTLRAFYDATSFWPFQALWSGRTRFVAREIPLRTLAVAILVFVALFFLHHRLFA